MAPPAPLRTGELLRLCVWLAARVVLTLHSGGVGS